jgi:hypothetical protein
MPPPSAIGWFGLGELAVVAESASATQNSDADEQREEADGRGQRSGQEVLFRAT